MTIWRLFFKGMTAKGKQESGKSGMEEKQIKLTLRPQTLTKNQGEEE